MEKNIDISDVLEGFKPAEDVHDETETEVDKGGGSNKSSDLGFKVTRMKIKMITDHLTECVLLF